MLDTIKLIKFKFYTFLIGILIYIIYIYIFNLKRILFFLMIISIPILYSFVYEMHVITPEEMLLLEKGRSPIFPKKNKSKENKRIDPKEKIEKSKSPKNKEKNNGH